MIEKGADINVRNNKGEIPIFYFFDKANVSMSEKIRLGAGVGRMAGIKSLLESQNEL